MYENNTIIRSPALAEAWIKAIVAAYGGSDFVSYPSDCAEIVRHFDSDGVAITISEANSFWSAHSENLSSGWVVIAQDCVAALDMLAEDIEAGYCKVSSLAALRGAVAAEIA
jgi:hypothetical protein